MKSHVLLIMFTIFSFTEMIAQTETERKFKWGCSFAVNSIPAQIGIPGGTGLHMDADGNIISSQSIYFSGGNQTNKSASFSLIPKYYLKENLLIRFAFGITNLDVEQDDDIEDIGGHEFEKQKLQQKIFRYEPGMQLNYIRKKYFEAYCGVMLSYIQYGILTSTDYIESRDLPTDTFYASTNIKRTVPGGFTTGIG